MRVLVGPRVDLSAGEVAAAIAQRLAGAEGPVVPLREAGVARLSRRLSAAEVQLLREAMLGMDPERYAVGERGLDHDTDRVVGYVCLGTRAPSGAPSEPASLAERRPASPGTSERPRVVAVTDHANLTWRSPLSGPNDDRLGPRFPSMARAYAPEVVASCACPGEGMIVARGVVAGVLDDSSPTRFEAELAGTQAFAALSSELVPVVIVAAHLGLRVAAAVVLS